MDWNKLLSSKTQMEHMKIPGSWGVYFVDEFDNDYRRIIGSEEFRALQDKMQVLSTEKNDFVRTRLTHSLEVSAIGKQLGTMVASNAKQTEKTDLFGEDADMYARRFSTILSTAGLLHDLGNSPFGHFGEEAVGNWFRENLEREDLEYKGTPIKYILSEQMKQDLFSFNGNAQTLRILSRPAVNGVSSDLDVTCSVINTLMKYPVNSIEADPNSPDGRAHKMGYFLSEKDFVERVRSECGLTGKEVYPLMFLLEASDDIGYVISDLEDVLSERVFTENELAQFCEQALAELPERGDEFYELQYAAAKNLINKQSRIVAEPGTDEERLRRTIRWIKFMKRWFIYAAADSFFNHYDEIMAGTYRGELLGDSFHGLTAGIFRKLMARYVYTEKNKLKTELAGNRIIMEFLDRFVPAVIYWEEDDCKERQTRINKGYIQIFPEKFLEDYRLRKTDDDAYNLYQRFLMVIDFVSSLTDSKAKRLYRELSGGLI